VRAFAGLQDLLVDEEQQRGVVVAQLHHPDRPDGRAEHRPARGCLPLDLGEQPFVLLHGRTDEQLPGGLAGAGGVAVLVGEDRLDRLGHRVDHILGCDDVGERAVAGSAAGAELVR
jgi:hypothetical protein